MDAEWITKLRTNSEEYSSSAGQYHSSSDIAELTLYLIRGLIVQRGVHHDEQHLEDMLTLWSDILKRAV